MRESVLRGPKWMYVAVLVVVAAGLVYNAGDFGAPDVDPELVAALQAVRKTPDEFAAIARKHGADGARAILDLLVEKYEGAGNYTDIYGWVFDDAKEELPGSLMGELADEGVRKRLVELLPEREFHPAFRRSLAVALCRPEHKVAADAILDRILDRQEDNTFRKNLLLRLPRLGIKPPPRLRELLYQPFEHLDILAAGALARMGDPEAPSLVLAGLEALPNHDSVAWHLAEATNGITGAQLPFEQHMVLSGSSRERWAKAEEMRVQPFIDALRAWMKTAPKTAFERTRRARVTLKSFDDILAAGEDFDLAEASMFVAGYKERWTLLRLEQLDHFADFLRKKLDGVTDPEERIAILNTWCLQRNTTADATIANSPRASFLPVVLGQDYGNCLGYSTLYVTLGERLGLPLHGVHSPYHCFVRYDDGRAYRNIETTAGGVDRRDEAYFTGENRGVFLQNRTKRQMLSAICSNHASTLTRRRDWEGAAEAAQWALRLSDRNPNAYLVHALALFNLKIGNKPRVMDELREALALWPGDAKVCLTAGQMLTAYGELQRAWRYFERAHEIEQTSRTLAFRAQCRARMGDAAAALESLREPVQREPDHRLLRIAELEARLRLEPTKAEELVPRLAEATGAPLEIHVAAARTLAETGHPIVAFELLDSVHKLAKRTRKDAFLEGGFDEVLRPEDLVSKKRHYYLVRALALHAAGHGDQARAALAEAEATGPPGFFVLKARRELR